MYPDHYNVPDDLDIRLIGYVRWAESDQGHHVTTLWRDSHGRDYYHEDLWTPYAPPFWLSTAITDLTPCNAEQFAEYADGICQSIDILDECISAYYRYRELMSVWGCAKGVEIGFAWALQLNTDE